MENRTDRIDAYGLIVYNMTWSMTFPSPVGYIPDRKIQWTSTSVPIDIWLLNTYGRVDYMKLEKLKRCQHIARKYLERRRERILRQPHLSRDIWKLILEF